MSLKLNIGAELPRSRANGPGIRYVIWMQGCPVRCKGCFNPEFQPFVSRSWFDVNEIAERILSTKDIEGVTYSGGEPFVQAEALYHLSLLLKRHELGVLSYSGFTLAELRRKSDPYVERLLGEIDLLIDGPYEEEKKAALLWRGSSNQKIHLFSDRYLPFLPDTGKEHAEVELVIGEAKMLMTGVWRREFEEKLKSILEES